MSDRFLLQPNCSACGTSLEDISNLMIMMSVGESADLTCPKCGTIWRFWIEIEANQKKIGKKKNYGKLNQ